MNRKEILETAQSLVSNARNEEHGDARQGLALAERLYNEWSLCKKQGIPTGHDACIFMIFVKLARIACGSFNADDYVDIAGYAALAGELAQSPIGGMDD